MAVAQSLPQSVHEPVPLDRFAAILRMFGALCLIPSVRRIGIYSLSPLLDLWIQLSEDDEERDELRIYAALDELDALRLGPLVDVHLILANEVEADFPQDAAVVFERR